MGSGKSGNAVKLDGTNDYVSLPSGVVASANTSTVTAWVNLDAVSNWMRIFDFGSGTSTYMFLSPKNGANGKIRFAIKNNGSSEQIIEGQSALPTGGWHHVAVTLNGATGTLYVDGVQVGRNTAMTLKPSDLGATTQNWIGRSQSPIPISMDEWMTSVFIAELLLPARSLPLLNRHNRDKHKSYPTLPPPLESGGGVLGYIGNSDVSMLPRGGCDWGNAGEIPASKAAISPLITSYKPQVVKRI